MDAIKNNPYRVLGVYANSPKKDVVANKGKITAFGKVGKEVDLPTDFNTLFNSSPDRSLNAVAKAETALTLPKDQLRHALFWFVSDSPIDTIAFNHLKTGNIGKALEVWSKVENTSSLQNRAILNLHNNSYSPAFDALLILYRDYGTCFCEMLGYSAPITTIELQELFIEVLKGQTGIDLMNIYKSVGSEWQSLLQEGLTQPLINQIRKEIEEAKKLDTKDDQAQKKAGYKLIKITLPRLRKVDQIIGRSDIKYTKLADDLGIQILQCGINYFNNTSDDDDLEHAKAIQGKAIDVVVGRLARERVLENMEILDKLEKERPPKVIKSEVDQLENILLVFMAQSADVTTIRHFLSEVQSISSIIKTKVGEENELYQKLSNKCVSLALTKNIEAVNKAQEEAISSNFGLGIPSYAMSKLKTILRESWLVTLKLEKFYMSGEVKSHFNNNKGILKNLCNQLDIPLYSERSVTDMVRGTVSTTSSTSQLSSSTTTFQSHSTPPSQHYSGNNRGNNTSYDFVNWLSENIGCISGIALGIILFIIWLSIILE